MEDIINAQEQITQLVEKLRTASKHHLPTGTIFYRARACSCANELATIRLNPANELLTNPNSAKEDGRYHRIGDFPLYLAHDAITAQKEVIKNNTKWLVVGKYISNFPINVISLLPTDYKRSGFFFQGTNIPDVADSLYRIAHGDNYEETKEFINTLRKKDLIRNNDELFVIRYHSAKNSRGINYFLHGPVQSEQMLSLHPPFETDWGALTFEDYAIY